MTLIELSDITGHNIIITKYANQNNRWSASIEHAEVIERDNHGKLKEGVLASMYGSGASPRAALRDYTEKIKGGVLVFNAMSRDKRQEFNVPSTLTSSGRR
jgi:hypothetical protein